MDNSSYNQTPTASSYGDHMDSSTFSSIFKDIDFSSIDAGNYHDESCFSPPPGFRVWPTEKELNEIKYPTGYRFFPTDEELIEKYLRNKVYNKPLPCNVIVDVNLYGKDPFKLTEGWKSITENEWYCFTWRERKYPNGRRPNRTIAGGYWKPTNVVKKIVDGVGNTIGEKQPLDFYVGKHPIGTRTEWKMHEYKLQGDDSQKIDKAKDDMTLDWVLCRLYKKKNEIGRTDGAWANI